MNRKRCERLAGKFLRLKPAEQDLFLELAGFTVRNDLPPAPGQVVRPAPPVPDAIDAPEKSDAQNEDESGVDENEPHEA